MQGVFFMKKYYIAIFLLLFVNFIPQKTTLIDISEDIGRGEYLFIVEGKQEKGEFSSVFYNGNTTILTCPSYKAREKKDTIKCRILSQSLSFLGVESDALDVIKKLDAKIVQKSKTGDILSYYLWSGSLDSESVELFGEKVNMQIAITGGKVQIGIPILCGSY